MLFAGPIERRVMSVLTKKIAEAERQHQLQCKEIDEECDDRIRIIEGNRVRGKVSAADNIVENLIGNLV